MLKVINLLATYCETLIGLRFMLLWDMFSVRCLDEGLLALLGYIVEISVFRGFKR